MKRKLKSKETKEEKESWRISKNTTTNMNKGKVGNKWKMGRYRKWMTEIRERYKYSYDNEKRREKE